MEISWRDGITRTSYLPPEKPVWGQEAAVRTLCGTINWLKIERGVWQGCLPSPCLFNLYSENIMRNARPDELQAGLKIDRRNINNLRYVSDTTLMAESEEELKSLLMTVKEESKRARLRLNIKKKKKNLRSLTQWTWTWANSGEWGTGRSGVLQSMGSQRVRHDWLTEQQQWWFYS